MCVLGTFKKKLKILKTKFGKAESKKYKRRRFLKMFFKFRKIIFVVQVQRRGGARLSLCVPRVRHQPGDGGAAAPGAHAGGRAGHVPHTGRGTAPHPFHQLGYHCILGFCRQENVS